MGFLTGWFGPDSGTDYMEDWFDGDGTSVVVGTPGISKKTVLGTKAPRPQVPPWRKIDGPAGMMLQEVRRYLNEVQDRGHVWGNHVTVTFPGAGTSVRVDTGLGGPAEGYKKVSGPDIRVFDGSPPSGVDPTPERGVLWLQASGAGTVKLFIY